MALGHYVMLAAMMLTCLSLHCQLATARPSHAWPPNRGNVDHVESIRLDSPGGPQLLEVQHHPGGHHQEGPQLLEVQHHPRGHDQEGIVESRGIPFPRLGRVVPHAVEEDSRERGRARAQPTSLFDEVLASMREQTAPNHARDQAAYFNALSRYLCLHTRIDEDGSVRCV